MCRRSRAGGVCWWQRGRQVSKRTFSFRPWAAWQREALYPGNRHREESRFQVYLVGSACGTTSGLVCAELGPTTVVWAGDVDAGSVFRRWWPETQPCLSRSHRKQEECDRMTRAGRMRLEVWGAEILKQAELPPAIGSEDSKGLEGAEAEDRGD